MPAGLAQAGEALVAELYRRRGWRVLDRNWRHGREGEIDLVVSRDGQLVFCEVKTRSGTRFGTPAEAVGYRKQAQVRRLAAAWCAAHSVRARSIRFDVASVLWRRGDDPKIDLIESAF